MFQCGGCPPPCYKTIQSILEMILALHPSLTHAHTRRAGTHERVHFSSFHHTGVNFSRRLSAGRQRGVHGRRLTKINLQQNHRIA